MPWLAFLAAFFKSISTVSEKQVLKDTDAEIYTSELSFVLAIVSLPFLFFVKNFSFGVLDLLIVYVASIFSIISSVTAAYVIKKLDVSESSVLFSLSPIFITLLAVAFLKESLSALQVVGIIISCFGIFILEYHNKEHRGAAALPANAISHGAMSTLIEKNPVSDKNGMIYVIFFIF